MGGGLQKLERVGGWRGIDHDQVEFAAGMEIVKLRERRVGLGAGKLLGQLAVKGVAQDALPRRLDRR